MDVFDQKVSSYWIVPFTMSGLSWFSSCLHSLEAELMRYDYYLDEKSTFPKNNEDRK